MLDRTEEDICPRHPKLLVISGDENEWPSVPCIFGVMDIRECDEQQGSERGC
jgi:hypothetical protein